MIKKVINNLFCIVGCIGSMFVMSMSIIGMYEPDKPKKIYK